MKREGRPPAAMEKPPKKYLVIWEAVRKIPKGKVSTYGEIATLCGYLGQARLVGYALHNLPRGTKVPWHRVINAAGKISLSDMDGMAELQEGRLKKEGIRFTGERVNLWKYGWPRTPERTTPRGRNG